MATQEAKVFVQDNGVKRELKGEELAAYLAQAEADKAEYEAQQVAKAELMAYKQTVLDRLGITAEEAKLLLA